jgi:hypothetical protein
MEYPACYLRQPSINSYPSSSDTERSLCLSIYKNNTIADGGKCMCSSPKGGKTKPYLSSEVDSTFADMNSSEYSDMVKRANESYEKRQEELAELRKNRVYAQPLAQNHIPVISLYEKIKCYLMQSIFTHQIEKK